MVFRIRSRTPWIGGGRQSALARVGTSLGVAMWLAGLGLVGTGAVAVAAVTTCSAPGASSGQISKNINTSLGCNVAGGSENLPATGWISVGIPSTDAGGVVTLVDAFQAVGLQGTSRSEQNYTGNYLMTLSSCTGGATASGGNYVIGSYSGGAGSNGYPDVPPYTGTLPTITGTAGTTVSCAYQIASGTPTITPPALTFASGVNSIWAAFGAATAGFATHSRSNSVKLFGTSGFSITSISTKTSATSPVAIGTKVYDTATLSGETSTAGGTVSYALYSDSNCTIQVADLTPSTDTVVNGQLPNSAPYTFDSAGTYYFQATYSGDVNNAGAVSSCTSEEMVVQKDKPTISTQTVPGSPVAIGTSVHDTAALQGATSNAGGAVTYALYKDSACSQEVADLTPTDNSVLNGVVPASKSYTFTSAGIWYFQATYSGDNNNAGPVSSPCTSEEIVVSEDSPSISTQTVPGSPVAIGASVYDTATLSGATANASGYVTYGLFSDSSCSQEVADLTPTDNSVVNAVVPASEPYTFTAAGTYYFRATYSGDNNNTGPVSSPCMSEVMVVQKDTPTISTQTVPGSPVAIGTPVYDTATLSGATANASGYVTYGLFSDSSCKAEVANLTPTDNGVVGGVAPQSNPYTFTAAGTWYFQATYSGDNNNAGPVSSPCMSEEMVVQKDTPTVSTQTVPGSPVAIGTSVYDTASLSGATANASGTVSYGLFSDSACTQEVADLTPTDNSVTGGSVPESIPYTFNAAGTWYFQATYSGDNNNAGPVSSPCGSEKVVVNENLVSISTQTVPGSPVAIGTSVHDTAALSGATANASGYVTYGLFSDSSCKSEVANLTPTDNSVVGGVVPASKSYTFNAAGTWYFQATYSGDSNNAGPVSSPCTSEAMVVSKDSPSIATKTSAPSPVATNTSVHDTATLSGATSDASGTVTYGLFSDSSCQVEVANLTPTDNSVVNGVVPDSNSYNFPTAGTYYFQATYSGDSNNAGPVSSPCTSEEMVVTSPAGGVLGAQTPTPSTGAGIFGGLLLLILGSVLVAVGAEIRHRRVRTAS